ncbi:MAG: hypothetical protein ABIP93_06575 [Gemmatimonadaceae bacterium]
MSRNPNGPRRNLLLAHEARATLRAEQQKTKYSLGDLPTRSGHHVQLEESELVVSVVEQRVAATRDVIVDSTARRMT